MSVSRGRGARSSGETYRGYALHRAAPLRAAPSRPRAVAVFCDHRAYSAATFFSLKFSSRKLLQFLSLGHFQPAVILLLGVDGVPPPERAPLPCGLTQPASPPRSSASRYASPLIIRFSLRSSGYRTPDVRIMGSRSRYTVYLGRHWRLSTWPNVTS
jgi:hypothetical protein